MANDGKSGFNVRNLIKKPNGGFEPTIVNVTDKDYYVDPRMREDFEGIEATVKSSELFGTEMGHRGYLLTGPPGTGKTLGVKYVATKLNLPLYDGKGLSSPQQVADFYAALRNATDGGKKKVLALLDEVDRFSNRDDVVDTGSQQTLNQLLIEMDGTASNNGIFAFGLTNKPDIMDNALRRPGRFSKEIEFMPPDKGGRLEILKMHAHGRGGHQFKVDDEDLEFIAGVTFGYTGGDLRGLLDESFTKAVIGGSRKVTREHLQYALKRTKPSAIRDMPFREPARKFADVGGYETHKEVVRRIVGRGDGSLVLIYGPSGTGKTDFVEAWAGEYGFNFIVVSGSEPEDKFVGETGKKIDKYLSRAKQLAPCVLLFDELDALVEKKDTESWKSSWTGLLQSRLSRPIPGVHIVGTMNRPDRLNKPLINRFPHRLYFGLPTPEEQVEIWRKFLRNTDINPQEIVDSNNGLTGRDIAHAAQLVRDYGLEPSLEVYTSLVKDSGDKDEEDKEAYEEMREKTGDSVRDFELVRRFVKKEEKK